MVLDKYLKDKQFNKIKLIFGPTDENNCQYNYLKDYGEKLYPIEKRIDKETTLNNLKFLLNSIYHDNFFSNKIQIYELFNENIFNNNLYFDILKIFYDYKEYLNGVIISTCTHYLDDNILMIFNMEKRLFNNINCTLELLYLTDVPIEKEQFKKYARLGIQCQTFVTPSNINYWINYYRKWKYIYKKYSQSILPNIIETKDNNWTEEQIDKYKNLLIYMVWDAFKICHFNSKKLAKCLWDKNLNQYFSLININNGPMIKLPCQIQDTLYIELNDLDIVPCQRAAYPELHIGHIDKEITEKSLEIGLDLWETKAFNLPKCSHCKFTNVCSHQCLGASYETYGEMFVPVINTCKLQQNKYITLYQIYKKLGVIKAAKKMNLLSNELIQLFNYLDNIIILNK